MNDLPLEVLALEKMASGNQSIRLTRVVTWEQFDGYAKRLVGELAGRIVDKADSAPERVWTVIIDGQQFWLAFDDFALGVSLDPCDEQAAAKIAAIRERLIELRTRKSGLR